MIPKIRNNSELLLGVGIVAIGLVIAFNAAVMKAGPLYAKMGPAVIPWLVAIVLVLCGGLIAWQGLRTENTDTEKNELAGPVIITVGLLIQVFLFERVGFILTATLLFFLTAFGFGSRRYFRDSLVAIILAGIAYIIFRYGLGLNLPIGLLFS